MKRIDRRALFATGAAAALLAATGVSAEPRRGGRLRVALSSADLLTDVGETCLSEGLTEIAADGTLRGEIATHWDSDPMSRHWHFDLRETVFHDGLPLTKADLQTSLGHLGSVALNGSTLQIVLKKPDPNLPFELAQTRNLIRPANEERRMAGFRTGLYRLRKKDTDRHLIADRVSEHWKDGQAGWFDTIELVRFSDNAVRAQALREGLVDLADISELDAFTDPKDFTPLPDLARPVQFVSKAIAVPSRIGTALPLDNLRMSERWWMA